MDNPPSKHAKGASETPAFTSECNGTPTNNATSASSSSFSSQKSENGHHGHPVGEKESIAGLMKDMKLGAREVESSVHPTAYNLAEHDRVELHTPLKARVSEEEIKVSTQQSGREDEEVPSAGEQCKPKAIDVARYFWSRLDLAYQLYLRNRHDECRSLILGLLPMTPIPPACRSELLQQLAVIEPLEQALGYLDEVDEICREMAQGAPGSEQVAQLRNKTANLRRLVRRVDEAKRQERMPDDESKCKIDGEDDRSTEEVTEV